MDERRTATHVHPYLDPVSWAAAIQLLGGGAAWAWVRTRRLLRISSASHGGGPVDIKVALDRLTQPSTSPRLVFIIEGRRDWPFLQTVASSVLNARFEAWVISRDDLSDGAFVPASWQTVSNLGEMAWQTLNASLHANMVLTTLTDLGESSFPKSASARYAYIFHSLVSPHLAYSATAFSAFDIIFAPGPRHMHELTALFQSQHIDCPEIRISGYPVLDLPVDRALNDKPSVLIAPSWTSDSMLERVWRYIVQQFLVDGWIVTFRPHPETLKRSSELLAALVKSLDDPCDFTLDLSAGEGVPAPISDLLITDWSGIALEWAAIGHGYILFIDTPRKIRNPKGAEAASATIEDDMRDGNIIRMDALDSVVARARCRLAAPPKAMLEDVLPPTRSAGPDIASIVLSRIGQ